MQLDFRLLFESVPGLFLVVEPAPPFRIFEQAPMPMVILRGPAHVIELANVQARRVSGREHTEVVGRPLLEVMPELRGQITERLLDEVLRTGVAHAGKELQVDFDPEGRGTPERHHFSFAFAPLRGVHGEVEGVLAVAFDVSAQVQARQEVDGLRREAEAANRSKDQFLAMLGHELRNPLAPMVAALQLLRMRGQSTREQAIMERQLDQLIHLVDDLLDVSRVAQDKIELRREPVELAAVVARGVEMAAPLLEQRAQRLTIAVPATGLVIHGDPPRLAQVVSNLLTNAAKYSQPRSSITVSAARVGERAVLRVRDSGFGIAAEMLPRIFDRFVQQDQPTDRACGGLGLGLTIVRSLVELHGGTVTAASPGLGQGSEFTVDLPLAPAELRAATPAQAPAENAEHESAAKGKRILVVDDNDDAAAAMAALLGDLGYQVEVAHDGQTALASAERFHPDVALLDIGLPVMDGYEVARRLRSSAGAVEGVRLVAVTGFGQDTDRQRTREAGFNDHLVKPVSLEALAKVVEG
jgi:PAS domain S-box-containing protein